jgi:hypothetical protein
VVALTEPFIPAADEVDKLEFGRDAASQFYRNIATRHVQGLRTTQGTYIVTPSGILLVTVHRVEEADLVAFLENGLEQYQQLSKQERLGTRALASVKRTSFYPDEGLVLKVNLRKFYAQKPVGRAAIGMVEKNQDFAWYRKEEARRFLPATPREDDVHTVPRQFVERLARFHFTDTVRAFADPYPARCVKEAWLKASVLEVNDGVVKLRFDGAVRSAQNDTPRFGLLSMRGRLPRRAERSFQADLLGYATFDLEKQRFTRFELVALGIQQGGGERSSPAAVPIGVALTLARDTPIEHVEPLRLELYGWK